MIERRRVHARGIGPRGPDRHAICGWRDQGSPRRREIRRALHAFDHVHLLDRGCGRSIPPITFWFFRSTRWKMTISIARACFDRESARGPVFGHRGHGRSASAWASGHKGPERRGCPPRPSLTVEIRGRIMMTRCNGLGNAGGTQAPRFFRQYRGPCQGRGGEILRPLSTWDPPKPLMSQLRFGTGSRQFKGNGEGGSFIVNGIMDCGRGHAAPLGYWECANQSCPTMGAASWMAQVKVSIRALPAIIDASGRPNGSAFRQRYSLWSGRAQGCGSGRQKRHLCRPRPLYLWFGARNGRKRV